MISFFINNVLVNIYNSESKNSEQQICLMQEPQNLDTPIQYGENNTSFSGCKSSILGGLMLLSFGILFWKLDDNISCE